MGPGDRLKLFVHKCAQRATRCLPEAILLVLGKASLIIIWLRKILSSSGDRVYSRLCTVITLLMCLNLHADSFIFTDITMSSGSGSSKSFFESIP